MTHPTQVIASTYVRSDPSHNSASPLHYPTAMKAARQSSRPRLSAKLSLANTATLLGALTAMAALAACSTYKPGTLTLEHGDASEIVGCIDVAVEPLLDLKAEGPAAKIFVGNRCDAAVVIDYQAIQANIHYTDGDIARGQIYDPHGTLRPVTLDARSRGWEAFEYQSLNLSNGDRIPRLLCLDVSRIDRDQPNPHARAICVEVEGGTTITTEEIL